MNIGDIMSREVQICGVDDSLEHAAQLMWEHDCGVVPIVDSKGRVLAMLTDRDVCMAAYTQGKPLSAIPVAVAASRTLHTVRDSDGVEIAEALMRAHRVRRLPVVSADGALVGIVSLNDLARRVHGGRKHDGLNAESVARTLAAVCTPHVRASSLAAE